MKNTIFKFQKGILHIGLPLLILAGSAVTVFVILKVLGVIGANPTEPIGQIHADPETVAGYGTSDLSVRLTATDVEASAGAQIDHIRYYLINPTLAPGNTWGDPDWCGSASPCTQSSQGIVTYDIKHSSNPGNDYEVVWDKNTISSESTQKDRSLKMSNLLPGEYRVALRVEDVFGNVTGNASEVMVELTQNPASGQLQVSTNQIYNFGVEDAIITLNAMNVQGANGAQIDNVRYFALSPFLASGNTWGDPDWCSGITPCNQSTNALYKTYDLGESSNPANNYEIVWNKDSQTSNSTPFERGLTAANVLSSEQSSGASIRIGMRIEDVFGNVTGNASEAYVNLSSLPEPSPEPELGLEISAKNNDINLTIEQGETAANVLSVTSIGASTYELYTPTSSFGIRFVPSNGSITPGSTIDVAVEVNSSQAIGTYIGEVVASSDLLTAQTTVGIPTNITVVEPPSPPDLGLEFSVTSINLALSAGETASNAMTITSTGATRYELYTPTPTFGIRWQPSSGSIIPGQTIPIAVFVDSGQQPGNYVGEIYAGTDLAGPLNPGIPTDITVINPNPVITLTSVDKVCNGTNELAQLIWTENIGTDYFDIYRSDRGYYTNNAAVGDTWQGAIPETGTFTFKVRNHPWELTGGRPVESNELSITMNQCVGVAGTVVSTQLFSQGLIDEDIWEGDVIYGQQTAINNPQIMEGYHFWARPVVNLMKKSELFTSIVGFIATPVLTQIAYEAGTVESGSLIGNVILEGGKSVSGFVGNFVDEPAYTSASN